MPRRAPGRRFREVPSTVTEGSTTPPPAQRRRTQRNVAEDTGAAPLPMQSTEAALSQRPRATRAKGKAQPRPRAALVQSNVAEDLEDTIPAVLAPLSQPEPLPVSTAVVPADAHGDGGEGEESNDSSAEAYIACQVCKQCFLGGSGPGSHGMEFLR